MFHSHAHCLSLSLKGVKNDSTAPSFSCVVKYGHAKVDVNDIELNLDQLKDFVESTWVAFQIMEYELWHSSNGKEFAVKDQESLIRAVNIVQSSGTASVSTSPPIPQFKLQKKCLGFSSYAEPKRKADVLERLNVRMNDVTLEAFIRGMIMPPKVENAIEDQVNLIQQELLRRSGKISLSSHVTEYTKREFISPVLVGCLHLLKDVTMVCEKKIIGTFGNGPVDYVLMYKSLHILLTEAKKGDIEGGVMQNLVQ